MRSSRSTSGPADTSIRLASSQPPIFAAIYPVLSIKYRVLSIECAVSTSWHSGHCRTEQSDHAWSRVWCCCVVHSMVRPKSLVVPASVVMFLLLLSLFSLFLVSLRIWCLLRCTKHVRRLVDKTHTKTLPWGKRWSSISQSSQYGVSITSPGAM